MLEDQSGLFDRDEDFAYFNSAAVSPVLRSVREAGEAGLARRAAPWTIRAEDWFAPSEQLRDSVARVLGADSDAFAFVPSTSYGLAIAARNLSLSAGQRVLILADEFPSSYYTWRRATEHTGAELVEVEREPGQTWADAVVEAIDERTAVVVVPNVHWTNGAWVDIPAVAARTREAGAELVIDASQSLGVLPLDLAELRPAFVVTVGYKWLLGPFSLCYLYVDERFRDGEPLEENWISREGAEDFSRLVDYTDSYAPGARRFDVGHRSNHILVPMAQAAFDQVESWGVSEVGATLDRITSDIASRVGALGLRTAPRDDRGPHILGVDLPQGSASRVSAALQERGVVASARGSSLRLSPHLHVDGRDIDRLVDALKTAL